MIVNVYPTHTNSNGFVIIIALVVLGVPLANSRHPEIGVGPRKQQIIHIHELVVTS